MTMQPAAPPAPPRPEDLSRIEAENAALRAQLENQALRGAVQAGPGRPGSPDGHPGSMSVVKDERGFVVVTTGDGRTITYDPKVGLGEDDIREVIETALVPHIPEDPNRGPNPEKIVAIVFTFLFLMSLLIAATRVLGKRAAASAAGGGAVSPEVAGRLARIEQAVEAVAIEVERISESERYTARLLTERLAEGAPAPRDGQGRPLPAAAPTLDAVR